MTKFRLFEQMFMLCFQSAKVISMDINQDIKRFDSWQERGSFSSPLHPKWLTQTFIQLVPRIKQLEHEVTTHLHLVPRLKMCGAIPPLLHIISSHGA
jgi:hypothetical protein